MFGIKPVWWVLINSFVAFAYLFFISKILGKKQIAQLEFIDYTVGISLGSIAADMAADGETPFYFYLIAMTVFFVSAFVIALVGRKNTFLKRLIKGKPVTLIYDGQINYKQLKRNKIDVNDLLSLLRTKNYFDIADVAYAVFEPSGELSVLPKGGQKPIVVEDMGIKPSSAELTNVLVADGALSRSGLNEIGKSVDWLMGKLGAPLSDVILATYDSKTDSVKTYLKNAV